jgi:fatty acid synthase, animal type
LARFLSTIIHPLEFFLLAGVKDATSVNNDLTLGDLGLDSLMGVEIKQMLERDYDITMEAKNIRTLTFSQLDALSSGKSQSANTQSAISEVPSASTAITPAIRYQLKHFAPAEQLVKLNNINNTSVTPVFIVSPIDGSVLLLEQVASQINAPVYGLQCTPHTALTSIPDLAKDYIKVLLFAYLCNAVSKFHIE